MLEYRHHVDWRRLSCQQCYAGFSTLASELALVCSFVPEPEAQKVQLQCQRAAADQEACRFYQLMLYRLESLGMCFALGLVEVSVICRILELVLDYLSEEVTAMVTRFLLPRNHAEPSL